MSQIIQLDANAKLWSAGDTCYHFYSNKLSTMTKLNAAIQFDGKWFVSRCLDLPVTSQGPTAGEAKRNLAEAIELYIETWGADELETSVGEPQLATVEVAV